ncbi:hypothetical protein C493_18476 [Natronolimnohabitans innermongolicus JCM 12255]|uniref:Uncharacterized protein n=1 Tax=Natronolimnohabitans innermongolicus JCM 12255 TaxID=1227499 RepID=L9WNQ5_9EURY|nr:hypothetical protein C493_18476 [Natronolimnohabitans innermongolicus JCM 12255]
MFVDERLDVRRDRIVRFDGVGKLVDDDDPFFVGEFLPEVVESAVPAVDAGYLVAEVVGDLFDELFSLSVSGLFGCEEVDVWPTATELREQFDLSDSAPSVDDL